MFARKGTFAGILLSLSVGSILFLGACYVTENTKTNYELTLRADDGLGSDIQVYEQSDRLSDIVETFFRPRVTQFHLLFASLEPWIQPVYALWLMVHL